MDKEKDREHRREHKRELRLLVPKRLHQTEQRYRQTHPDIMNAKTKRWRENHKDELKQKKLELKQLILTHYGNGKLVCTTCGEGRIECLSIDHMNNNGNQHRKEIGNLSGNGFYSWLKRENLPIGYQTLCMNCQFIKALTKTGE